jgi:pseudouridine synthase
MPKRPPKKRNSRRHFGAARLKSRSADLQDSDGRPRLQKVLAAAGLGSRRDCEEMIREGRVEIDRRVVSQLGTRVDPGVQEIRVDGERLTQGKRQYFVLNKPVGVVSTARDPAGRPRVTDLVKTGQRLFPVGRLDISTEGLIILTNDGDFANLLAHPRYEIEKTYLAQVAGTPTRDAVAKLERGVRLAEGFAHAKRVRIKSQQKHSATLEIVLDEGRNREVRRLLARIGHKVLRLKRIAIGGLRLANLEPGEYRPLRPDEVRDLKEAAIATLNRDRQATTKRPEQSANNNAFREGSKMAQNLRVPVAEHEAGPEALGRPGTLIGADEAVAASSDRQSRKPETAGAKPVPRRSVTPLIDVRRGIFPAAVVDDLDDDELPLRAPAKKRTGPSKPFPRGIGRSKHSKEQGTSGGSRGKRVSKMPQRRKGRRR